MNYWEIIADNLSKAGWSLGWVSAVDCEGRTIWIVDAHRDDGSVPLCLRDALVSFRQNVGVSIFDVRNDLFYR